MLSYLITSSSVRIIWSLFKGAQRAKMIYIILYIIDVLCKGDVTPFTYGLVSYYIFCRLDIILGFTE